MAGPANAAADAIEIRRLSSRANSSVEYCAATSAPCANKTRERVKVVE